MARRWLPLSVLPLLAAGLVAAGGAQADTPPPSFVGESLYSSVGSEPAGESFEVVCNEDGSGTASWNIAGTAEGPYPGTFTETGSLTWGPVVDGHGVITSLDADFQVESSVGTVYGTKTLLNDTQISSNESKCEATTTSFGTIANVQYAHSWDVTIMTADSVYGQSGKGNAGGSFFYGGPQAHSYQLRENFTSSSTPVTFQSRRTPTSVDQCKNGGWQQYGVFKNQGDCVAFVETRESNPPG